MIYFTLFFYSFTRLATCYINDLTNDTTVGIRDHLELPNVKKACANRVKLCDGVVLPVCAMRVTNGTKELKQFNNDCFLFFSNMCDHPDNEFYIAEIGSCLLYLKSRRDIDIANFKVYDKNHKVIQPKRIEIVLKTTTSLVSETTPKILRQDAEEYEYESDDYVPIPRAFDDHICPRVCPDIYEPICINVNRNRGGMSRLYHFINHCKGDMYYCQNPDMFPKVDSEEAAEIALSRIQFSYCCANRYLNQARFFEYSSSLGYYGWLQKPDQRFSKILGSIPQWQKKG